MKRLILVCCLVFLVPRAKAQIDELLASQLQSVLNNHVNLFGNNGVSAHLILPDGETWTGTAGVGKQNIPISNTTLFYGASTTKLNIAILMLLLAEDNLIDLDLPWSNYITLNVDFDALITVRQLLSHTSGIADYLETSSSGADITSDFSQLYSPEYILKNIVSSVPVFPAGTDFQYSNSNYVLASIIVEAVTGNSVQSELRTRIWNPMQMNHTYYGSYEAYTGPTAGVWWNFGDGVTDYSDMPTKSMLSYVIGAGNIVTCPTDLALLLNGLMNNQLLNTESFNEMMTFIPESYSSWTSGYGLGIHHLNGQTEDTVIGHDGYYMNLTDMFYSTDYGFTLVTMTNTQTSWLAIINDMYDRTTNYFNNLDVTAFEDKIDLIIYPNPSNRQFNLVSTQIIDELEIYDALGRVYYHATPNDSEVSLILDNDGLYFVTVKSANKSETSKLIVSNSN